MAKKINFGKFKNRIAVMKLRLPRDIGVVAKKHFVDSFQRQGFTDRSLTKWKGRKRLSKADRRNRNRRSILVQKGTLRASIGVRSANFRRITVGSYGVRYARIHNRGLRGRAFGKHPFRMPKRQFIGKSKKMNQRISKLINKRVKEVFR